MKGRIAVVVAYIVVAVVLTPPIPTSAQRARVGEVDAVEGVGTVVREAAEPRSLRANDDVLVQDKIMTGSGSIVRIRFSTDAVATLRERSAMTISEENRNPVLRLELGALNYRGAGGNRRDEALAILTPNATARTAGGIRVATRAWDAVVETTVCALEGNGFAAALGGAEIEIPEWHCVWINGGVLGPVLPFPKPGTGMLSADGFSNPLRAGEYPFAWRTK